MNQPQIKNFADRLTHAISLAGAPACVGLDPVLERIPSLINRDAASSCAAIENFCCGILEAIDGAIPVVKFQSACFERYGADGFRVLEACLSQAAHMGFVTILDAKRGDIGVSAEHYAEFAFGRMGVDALTVNAYLGPDTLSPYLDWKGDGERDRGIFVLVRTSNPGSDAIQSRALAEGVSVAEMLADHVAEIGGTCMGECGYSSVGAVVAATKPEDSAALRALMPSQIFLVPGYGAQGGNVETVRGLFNRRGDGAVVTASRSVIFAFEPDDGRWQDSVRAAATSFVGDLRSLTPVS